LNAKKVVKDPEPIAVTEAVSPVSSISKPPARELSAEAQERKDRLTAIQAGREAVLELDELRRKAGDHEDAQNLRLEELEEAAEVARFGPRNAKVCLSGADSSKIRSADEAVEKQKVRLKKAEEAMFEQRKRNRKI
jgi:hypothetical protein